MPITDRLALARFHRLSAQTIAAETTDAAQEILRELARALRGERARMGHWTYDLNRHIGLMIAYRCGEGASGSHFGRNGSLIIKQMRRKGGAPAKGSRALTSKGPSLENAELICETISQATTESSSCCCNGS